MPLLIHAGPTTAVASALTTARKRQIATFAQDDECVVRDDLAEFADLIEGVIDEDGFAVDGFLGDGAEVAAVGRHVAMVAEDEEGVGGNGHFGVAAVVAIGGSNVGLVQLLSVDEDAALVDANAVAGDTDDALDVALGGVLRVAEDDDVAALDGFPAINELVDEDAFLVGKTGHHAGALDFHGLIDKDDDEDGDGGRYQDIAQPAQGQVTSPGRLCERWLRLNRILGQRVSGHCSYSSLLRAERNDSFYWTRFRGRGCGRGEVFCDRILARGDE